MLTRPGIPALASGACCWLLDSVISFGERNEIAKFINAVSK